MIGRNLSLQDTGAPKEAEVQRMTVQARKNRDAAVARMPAGLIWWLALAGEFRGRLAFEGRKPLRVWRELAALSLFVMGLSWAVPWFRSLSHATRSASSLATFLVLGFLGGMAYVSMRLLAELNVSRSGRNRTLTALLVLSILIGLRSLLYGKEVMPLTELVMRPLVAFGNFSALIPNEFLVVVAVLLVWRRGAVLSLDYIGPERVLGEFKTGFWMFLLFTGLNTIVTRESVPFGYLSIYLFSGLLAMGAARMSAVSEVRGGSRNVFDRQRFYGVILSVAAAAGFAIWVAFQFSRDDMALAGALVLLFVLGAFTVSIPLLLAILYLLYEGIRMFQEEIAASLDRMLQLIDSLLGLFGNLATWLKDFGIQLADRLAFLAPIFRWLFSLAPAMRFVVLVGSVLIVGALVYMAFWIRARRLREGVDGAHESALSLGNLMDRFRRKLQDAYQDRRQQLAGMFNMKELQQRRMAARIRRLYARVLHLAHRMGLEREAAQTPKEFERALARLFPGCEGDVALLTEAYLQVRYGEIPEGRAEVLTAERAFRRIQASAAGHPTLLLKRR